MKIIDLSCTYKSGQIAGNPKRHPVVALKRMGRIEDVGFNTSSILLGSHTGRRASSLFRRGNAHRQNRSEFVLRPCNNR